MFGISLTFICAGLLLAALAYPLMHEMIAPNRWYGVRLPQTLRNERAWYAANRYGGRLLFAAGLTVTLVASLLSFVPGIDVETYAVFCVGATLGSVGWATARTLLFARKV